MASTWHATTSGGERSAPRWANLPLPEPHLATLALGAILERRWPLGLRAGAHRRAVVDTVVGTALTGVGVGLIAAAWQATARTDLEAPDRLVAHGPYAYSRNPMYVGWAALHLGTSLLAGSGWMLAGLPVALGLVHRQVLREERALGAAFGAAFDRYRRNVPRYLPGRRSDLNRDLNLHSRLRDGGSDGAQCPPAAAR